MNRNLLVLLIVVLAVAVGVLGYRLYQSEKQPDGVQINLGQNGITMKKQ